jgi:hypothetical protein
MHASIRINYIQRVIGFSSALSTDSSALSLGSVMSGERTRIGEFHHFSR